MAKTTYDLLEDIRNKELGVAKEVAAVESIEVLMDPKKGNLSGKIIKGLRDYFESGVVYPTCTPEQAKYIVLGIHIGLLLAKGRGFDYDNADYKETGNESTPVNSWL